MSRHKKRKHISTDQNAQTGENQGMQKTPPPASEKKGGEESERKMPDWETIRVAPFEIDDFISAYDGPLDGNEWIEAIEAYEFGIEPKPNSRVRIFYDAYRESLENGVSVEEVLGLC